MNEFVEECRREWRRLGVPDPIANEMAADLTADIEEAESEGGTAEDVVGNGAFDPRRLRRIVGNGSRCHCPACDHFSAPPLASSRLRPHSQHGPARLGRRHLGGRSPERRCHLFGEPESGRAQVDPCVPWFSHRAATLPASSGRRCRGPPLSGRWRRGRRSRRSVLGPLERHPHRPLGDPQTPPSLGNPRGMTDLACPTLASRRPTRRASDRLVFPGIRRSPADAEKHHSVGGHNGPASMSSS